MATWCLDVELIRLRAASGDDPTCGSRRAGAKRAAGCSFRHAPHIGLECVRDHYM